MVFVARPHRLSSRPHSLGVGGLGGDEAVGHADRLAGRALRVVFPVP